MRGFYEKHKKMLALLLVVAMVFSVTRPGMLQKVAASGDEATVTDAAPAEEVAETDTADVTNDEVTDVADNDESVADSVSDDTEVDDADEADEDEEEDDPTIMAAKTLHVRVEESKCDITINAPEGSLPYAEDELSVSVKEFTEGSVKYDYYLDKAAVALDQNSPDNISFARFFDIEILANGEKVEPESPVEVKIEYDEAPEMESGDELSIVHFADNGVEVIDDIDINKDATEIVYEQESFSVTATIISGNPIDSYGVPSEKDFILVAEVKDGSEYTYYSVQSNGSLKKINDVSTDTNGNKVVKDEGAFVWKYSHWWDGKEYLRYTSDGFDYDRESKLARAYAYTLVDPKTNSGLIESVPVHVEDDYRTVERVDPNNSNSEPVYENDIGPRYSPITINNNEIYSGSDYLTVNNGKIQGKSSSGASDNVKFYLAAPTLTSQEMDDNHEVNHIDISISDYIDADVYLAYGTYYDYQGKAIIEVTPKKYPEGYKVHIRQKVSVSQGQLRKAKITAHKKNSDGTPGELLDDAFYITGYNGNAKTSISTPQVRIEGVFKVAYDMSYSGSKPDPNDPSLMIEANNDPEIWAERLQKTVLYSVEATEPNAKFYYTNPFYTKDITDPANAEDPARFLYDADGNALYTESDVTINSTFDYFDPENECPALKEAPWKNWDYDIENNYVKGRIHSQNFSGMDFQLKGEVSFDINPVAINIDTFFIDEDGNPIIPENPITGLEFGVRSKTPGDHSETENLNVGKYDTEPNYNGYIDETVKTIDTVDGTNSGIVYEYDLPNGLIYITENKDTVPDSIKDKDGNVWEYSHTYIETEYARRKDTDPYQDDHMSDTYDKSDREYRSVPEILGDCGQPKFNRFLEFHVHNVYDKVVLPHKKEIAPYEGDGALGGVNPGDEITYEISYTNYKSIPSNVYIRDVLDDNVEFVSASDNGQFAVDRVAWTINDVPAGKEGKVTLTVKVKDSAETKNGGPGYVKNGGDTAKVSIGNGNWYTLEEVENPVPKTSEKREISPYEGNGTLGEVAVKGLVVYEITYKNYKDAAADIVITDKLDPNVEFVEASDGGKNEDGTVKWTLSNVPAGKEGSVTLTVKVLRSALSSKGGPGEIVNGGKTSTVKVGNDKAYSLDLVKNPVVDTPETLVAPHKREVSPYVGNGKLGEVKVGEKIVYEISYTNYKNDPADIVIIDKLDANVEFVEASDDGVYDKDAGTVTWTIKDVPAEKEGSVTLTVKVLESALAVNDGPGKVLNGGETATVQVGNDAIFTLEEVENPVITSSTKSKTDKTTTAVKTGDSMPIIPIIIVMAVALVGIISVIVIRRKKAKNEPEKNK